MGRNRARRAAIAVAWAVLVTACGPAVATPSTSHGEVSQPSTAAAAASAVPSAGSVIFSPSTLICSSPSDVKISAVLPNTVHGGDIVTFEFDGQSSPSASFAIEQNTASPVPNENSAYIAEQPNGTWVVVVAESASDVQFQCGPQPGQTIPPAYRPGSHTVEYLDARGNIVAQGGFTVAP